MRAILYKGHRVSDKKGPFYRAYKSWADQKSRCYNPNDPRFKWWGAKGIKVEYTSLDFIKWWDIQMKRNGSLKRPNCSRIDHSKNYSLDNIELLECSENSRETWVRSKRKSIGIIAIHRFEGKVLYFNSAHSASKATNVAQSAILHQLEVKFKRTVRCPWIFIRSSKFSDKG